jgi:hypothetical protein
MSLSGEFAIVSEPTRIGLNRLPVLQEQQPFLAGGHGARKRFRCLQSGSAAA